MIRTVLVAASLALAVLLILPWLVLWSLITGSPTLMYRLAMKIVRLETRLLGVRVRVEGLENVPQGPCVFVANHTSNIDPMALIPAIPQRVGILVKQELFRIPIFARAMHVAQFVPVARGDREQTTAAVSAAVQNLKKGLSYVIFSEGTRSPDGRLRPFKRGAFTMAIEAGVPVAPVSIVVRIT
jgi:1-acyl-sn-glycerol-3-phosphate acyltransferase